MTEWNPKTYSKSRLVVTEGRDLTSEEMTAPASRRSDSRGRERQGAAHGQL